MTQEPTEGQAGADAPTIAPPTGRPDVEALMSEGVAEILADEQRAAAPPPPPAPEPETEPPEDEDEDESADDELEEDDDTDDEEEDDESETPDAEAEVLRWAKIVADKVQRFAEVPTEYREGAFKTIIQQAYLQGARYGYQQAAPQIDAVSRAARLVAEKDTLYRDDRDAFDEWAEANPAEAARYYAAKSGQAIPEAPPESPIQERANRHFARLAQYPEAQRRILAKLEGGSYPLTDEGLDALALDVGAELARAQTSDAEEAERAERRKRAAKRRKAAPKPMSGPSDGPARPAISNNYRELLAEGVVEEEMLARNGRIPAATADQAR